MEEEWENRRFQERTFFFSLSPHFRFSGSFRQAAFCTRTLLGVS